MKALITAAVISAVVLASTQASAHHRRLLVVAGPIYVPTATCVTNATKEPLPEYVCCKMRDGNGHMAWKNNWVSGGCRTIGAHVSFGCGMASPVYGTGSPIIGQCQFSRSTGMFARMSYYKDAGYFHHHYYYQ